MGKGGDGRGHRRMMPRGSEEAQWWEHPAPHWEQGGGYSYGKGGYGKGHRMPPSQDLRQGGKGRRNAEEDDDVEVEEDEDSGAAAEPWKLLLDDNQPAQHSAQQTQADEEWQEDGSGWDDEGKDSAFSSGRSRPAWDWEAADDRPAKRRREDDVLALAMELSSVPLEYTHSTLVELHESLGLDPVSLATSKFLDPTVDDEEHTCKVILQYTNKNSAMDAVSKLRGFGVTTKDGVSRRLAAQLQSEKGSTARNPQVRLSSVPADFTEEALRDLHVAAGLPDYGLVSLKFLPPKEGEGNSKNCIARYEDDQLAERAVEALNGKRVWADSGECMDLVAKRAQAPKGEAKGNGRQKRPRQEPEVSRELLDFAKRWGVDDETIDYIARLSTEVQTNIIDRFDPQESAGNLITNLRAFARQLQSEVEQTEQLEKFDPGSTHTGTVKVWFEDRGFGFISPDSAGTPDVYVHRRVLTDGSHLVPQTKVTFRAFWDVNKCKYLAEECWGAQGERQDPPAQPSSELLAFADRWSLDRGAVGYLARMSEEVQKHVLANYRPEEEEDGDDSLFVSGLPVGTDETLIRNIFGEHGTVLKCKVLARRGNKQDDAAALVQLADAGEAERAITRLSQATPEGCKGPISLRFASSIFDKGKGKGKGKGKRKVVNHSKAIIVLAKNAQTQMEPSRPTPAPPPAPPAPVPEEAAKEWPQDTQAETEVAPAAASSNDGSMEEIPLGVPLPGVVKFWNDTKSYGFVNPRGGGPDVFVHKKQLKDGVRLMREMEVTFVAEWDEEGWRYRAAEVSGAGDMQAGPPADQLALAVRAGPPSGPASAAVTARSDNGPSTARYQGIVKAWFEDRGFGFIAPSTGGSDIYVHRSKLTDGAYLVPDTQVHFNIHWDPARQQYVTRELWGAQGERQEPPNKPSEELQSFCDRWSLDREALIVLAKLPEEIQLKVIADYQPEEPEPYEEEDQNGESVSLFVSGLPLYADDEMVMRIFSEYGPVEMSKVLLTKNSTRQNDRAAIVRMAGVDVAEHAIAGLTQEAPEGCVNPLTVRYAENQNKKGKGKGKITGGNHSKAVVMLARSYQASCEPEETAGMPALTYQPTAGTSSSSSAEPADGEIQCGVLLQGIVKFWNEAKNYGFINPEAGGPDVFVHRKQLKDGMRLHRNTSVTFIAEWDNEGWRYRAAEVNGATDLPEPLKGGGKGKLGPGAARPGAPPAPPALPSGTAPDGRPMWLHVPPPLPPHKQALLEQQRQSARDQRNGDAPRPPDGSMPSWLQGQNDTGSAPKLTPTAKVRPRGSLEADVYGAGMTMEASPGQAATEDEWAAGVDEEEAQGGFAEQQWQGQQTWGEGGQWPAEGLGGYPAEGYPAEAYPADPSWPTAQGYAAEGYAEPPQPCPPPPAQAFAPQQGYPVADTQLQPQAYTQGLPPAPPGQAQAVPMQTFPPQVPSQGYVPPPPAQGYVPPPPTQPYPAQGFPPQAFPPAQGYPAAGGLPPPAPQGFPAAAQSFSVAQQAAAQQAAAQQAAAQQAAAQQAAAQQAAAAQAAARQAAALQQTFAAQQQQVQQQW